MPRLEPLLTIQADLAEPLDVGATPTGARRIFDIQGGTFEGPRLRGRVLPSGADWLVVGSDGVGRLDVRATFETHDGALVYVQYPGIVVFEGKLAAAAATGGETQFGDGHFMITPRFETGDPRYAWLHRVVAVGQGRLLPSAVAYRVFEVLNDEGE